MGCERFSATFRHTVRLTGAAPGVLCVHEHVCVCMRVCMFFVYLSTTGLTFSARQADGYLWPAPVGRTDASVLTICRPENGGKQTEENPSSPMIGFG